MGLGQFADLKEGGGRGGGLVKKEGVVLFEGGRGVYLDTYYIS